MRRTFRMGEVLAPGGSLVTVTTGVPVRRRRVPHPVRAAVLALAVLWAVASCVRTMM